MSEWKPMDRRLHRELWRLRFQKMLHLEKQAAKDYTGLIRECDEYQICGEDHPIKKQLKEILQDEKKHIKLVEELIEILNRQED